MGGGTRSARGANVRGLMGAHVIGSTGCTTKSGAGANVNGVIGAKIEAVSIATGCAVSDGSRAGEGAEEGAGSGSTGVEVGSACCVRQENE